MFLKRLFFSCILFILFSSTRIIYAQLPFNNNPVFESINKDNGLLQGQVMSICEDKEGYIWIASLGGLHRYDGTSFDYYLHNDTVAGSISSNSPHIVYIDSKNRLWVGTDNGLSLFISEKNNFKNFSSPEFAFKNFSIRAIAEDKEGNLWIATYGGGIAYFDPEKEKIITWYNKENASLDLNHANTIFCDSKGRIWAGTESIGVLLFNQKKKKFESVSKSLTDHIINHFLEDKDGRLWIGTWNSGLLCYDPQSGELKIYQEISNNNSIPDITIRHMAFDKQGKLWLASANGLGYFDPQTESCKSFRRSMYIPTSLPYDYLWSVMVDSKGMVWIGTFGNGVAKLDVNKNKFDVIDNRTPSFHLECNFVEFITLDSSGRLWAVANDRGVYVYKPGKENPFEHKIAFLAKDQKVRVVYEGKNDFIWLSCEGGLMRCTKDLKKCQYFPFGTKLKSMSPFSICEDVDGNLWMGGWNTGIMMLPAYKKKKEFINQDDFIFYNSNSKGNKYIPTDIIWIFYKDSQNDIWVGAFNHLLKWNKTSGKFDIVLKDVGNIPGIVEYTPGDIWIATASRGLINLNKDNAPKYFSIPSSRAVPIYDITRYKNRLWLGTEDGLYQFIISTKEMIGYNQIDGLPDNNYIRNSFCVMRDSSVLMGSLTGLLRFHPDNFLTNDDPEPLVRINDITLFNKSISLEHSSKAILNKSLTSLKELTFNYDQNVLSFYFSAIQHSIPERIKFAYKLDGFQNDWVIVTDNNRKASFTNLNPGTYYFKVRTVLKNGKIGNKETSLKLVILPPWWNTWWFKTLMVLCSIGLIFSVYFLRTRNIRMRNALLKKLVEDRTAQLQEANKSLMEKNNKIRQKTDQILEVQNELLEKKLSLEEKNAQLEEWTKVQQRLIGIIGHDIRGPIKRFSSLLKLMDKDSSEFVIKTLKENAEGISTLTTDLLSWVSLQNNLGHIEYTKFDWNEVLEKALKELEFLSTEKNISFVIVNKNEGEGIKVKGALPIVLASLRNIIYNSLRFSNEGSKIELEIDIKKENYIGMRITDFGEGFNAESVNKLIQGEGLKGMKEISLKEQAGLGLSICYDMLKKTGGWFEAASLPGSGASFFIYLPKFIEETKEV